MIFKQFFDEKSCTLTYVLAQKRGSEALIIDPVLEKVDDYLKFLGGNKLRLIKAMDTHIHADHITGLGKLRELTRCMTILGEESETAMVSQRIKDGDIISIEGVDLQAMYTPGHTDDSYCFYRKGMVFTGDTLFIRGNGRTDFQSGSPDDLYESLENKLFKLPEDTLVFPGHDYKGEHVSTLATERKENPRFAGNSKEEFVEIMNNLNLPNPKMMDVAVPANRKFGENVNKDIDQKLVLNIKEGKKLIGEATFIDLREDNEVVETGKIKGAIQLPYNEMEEALDDKDHPMAKAIKAGNKIVLYCAYGERSALGLKTALEKKVANVFHMEQGIFAWKDAGGPIDK
jgi:sulfur dioxygenase